jgi:hypothetical protein
MIVLVSSCATTKQIEDEYSSVAQLLPGTWKETGGTTCQIEMIKNVPKVVSIIDTDYESFVVKESNWENGILSWTYYVPSTEYTVHVETTSISKDTINYNWKNAYDEGTDTLSKVDIEPGTNERKANPAIKD